MKYILFASLFLAQAWSDGFDYRITPNRQPGTHYSAPQQSVDPIGYVVPLEDSVTHLLTATETEALISTFTPYVPPLPEVKP